MLKKEDVLSVAELAYLDLTDDEQKKYTSQLERVLALFEVLKKLDLKNVSETSQVTGLKNICQSDEVKYDKDLRPQNRSELISLSPRNDRESIIVPKVIKN